MPRAGQGALRQHGFPGALTRVIVSLAPAELRKEGPAFDLDRARLLLASGSWRRRRLDGVWSAGRTGALTASLRPVRGVIALPLAARRSGARALVGPACNGSEVGALLSRV